MEPKDIENPIAERDFRHQLRKEKLNDSSAEQKIVCHKCGNNEDDPITEWCHHFDCDKFKKRFERVIEP